MFSRKTVLRTITYLSLLLCSPILANASGGAGTNGGGTVVINSQRYTLGQAGLTGISNEQEQEDKLKEDLRPAIEKAKAIVELMPLTLTVKNKISKKIVEAKYIEENLRQNKYKKLKRQYVGMIKSFNPDFSTKSFEFAALSSSDDNNTYIDRQIFFGLNLEGQALKLIHESFVRRATLTQETYKALFSFDTVLVDYLRALDVGRKNLEEDLKLLYYFNGLINSYRGQGRSVLDDFMYSREIISVVASYSKTLKLSDLCESINLTKDNKYISCSQLRYAPTKSQMLLRGQYWPDDMPYGMYFVEKFFLRKEIFNNEKFEIVENKILNSIDVHVGLRGLALSFLMIREQFSRDCTRETHGEILFYSVQKLHKGLSLDFVAGLECHFRPSATQPTVYFGDYYVFR